VTIRGFPFLTQAISGEYDHSTINSIGVPIGNLLKDARSMPSYTEYTPRCQISWAGRTGQFRSARLKGQLTVRASDLQSCYSIATDPIPADVTM